MSPDLVVQESDHLSNHFVNINQRPLRRTLSEHQADSTDDLAGAGCVRDDSRRGFACFLRIWVFAVEPTQAGGGIDNGGSDRLIQFVCQRSRQLPHRGHPADVRKIRMSLTEHLALLICSDALGDVRDRPDVLQIT